MAVDFHIVEDARLPSLEVTVFDANGVMDLSGATSPVFYMSRPGTAAKVNGTAATIVNASEGKLRYDWAALDVDTPGDWYGQFAVTLNSKVLRIPSDGHIDIHIHQKR